MFVHYGRKKWVINSIVKQNLINKTIYSILFLCLFLFYSLCFFYTYFFDLNLNISNFNFTNISIVNNQLIEYFNFNSFPKIFYIFLLGTSFPFLFLFYNIKKSENKLLLLEKLELINQLDIVEIKNKNDILFKKLSNIDNKEYKDLINSKKELINNHLSDGYLSIKPENIGFIRLKIFEGEVYKNIFGLKYKKLMFEAIETLIRHKMFLDKSNTSIKVLGIKENAVKLDISSNEYIGKQILDKIENIIIEVMGFHKVYITKIENEYVFKNISEEDFVNISFLKKLELDNEFNFVSFDDINQDLVIKTKKDFLNKNPIKYIKMKKFKITQSFNVPFISIQTYKNGVFKLLSLKEEHLYLFDQLNKEYRLGVIDYYIDKCNLSTCLSIKNMNDKIVYLNVLTSFGQEYYGYDRFMVYLKKLFNNKDLKVKITDTTFMIKFK